MTGHRILHVLPSVVPTDGIARAVRELAARVPGEHHLVTNCAHGPFPGFDSLTEVGGANSTFTFRHATLVGDLVDRIDPHIVHVHGGSLATTMAYSPAFSGRRIVVGMHKWAQRPAWREVHPTRWQQRRASSVPPLLALGSALLSAPLNRLAIRGRVACRGLPRPAHHQPPQWHPPPSRGLRTRRCRGRRAPRPVQRNPPHRFRRQGGVRPRCGSAVVRIRGHPSEHRRRHLGAIASAHPGERGADSEESSAAGCPGRSRPARTRWPT